MDENKNKELVKGLLENCEAQEKGFEGMNVQETIYIYYLLGDEIKGKPDKPEYKKAQTFVFRMIISKLYSCEKIYVAYNKATKYPHVDDRGCAWLFSQKELADKAAEYYMNMLIAVYPVEVEQNRIGQTIGLMRNIYGIDKLLIDNGVFNVTVNTKALSSSAAEKEKSSTEIRSDLTNPELFCSILQYFENGYRAGIMKKDDKLMPMLENNMMGCITKANFLIPYKNNDKSAAMPAPGEVREVTDPTNIAIANIVNQEDNTSWIPVFTDWNEFRKMYNTDEWGGLVTGYKRLEIMCDHCTGGAVINPNGVPVRLDKLTRSRISSYLEDIVGETDFSHIPDSFEN
ncbi:MAG: SseB family protein [Oscillospiraceae bacterium]|nr:SseB family protein [Oscillospiraceae bacterium]